MGREVAVRAPYYGEDASLTARQRDAQGIQGGEMSAGTADRQKVLRRVKKAVRALEPGARIILYGSRARGEAMPDSDWDILVLVDGPVDYGRASRIRHLLYDLEAETNSLLSAIVRGKKEWEEGRLRATPLAERVRSEGVEL